MLELEYDNRFLFKKEQLNHQNHPQDAGRLVGSMDLTVTVLQMYLSQA